MGVVHSLPLMAYSSQLKSVVHSRAHSWGRVVGSDKIQVVSPPSQCHVERSQWPSRPSAAHLVLSRSHPLGAIGLLLSLTAGPFLGILRLESFSNRLLSLGNGHLRFFHVFSWLDSFIASPHGVLLCRMGVLQPLTCSPIGGWRELPGAAGTKYPELGGFEQPKCVVLQFKSLEV